MGIPDRSTGRPPETKIVALQRGSRVEHRRLHETRKAEKGRKTTGWKIFSRLLSVSYVEF